MNVQVNTDKNIEGKEELQQYVKSHLADNFTRFSNALTRIEVYLSDENAAKAGGNDKKCLLEARVANHQPIVVSHNADSIHQAIDGASDKLLRSLDTMVGKMTKNMSAKDFNGTEQTIHEEEE
jgi:ribosomal subunit interface protein